MGKLISLLGVFALTFLFVPLQVLAEETGAETVEPSNMLIILLTIMSIATLIAMIYYSLRDNG
ncbi:hypothetical protein GN156_10455 [bacterium LRH843]|nr:hypothetical protein [bacterium LRH843]